MKKIFFGLLFVFLHLKINGIDLLPNFVGYGLIWFGMGEVAESEKFQKGRGLALAAAILDVVTFVMARLWGDVEIVFILLLVPVGLVLQLLVTFRIMRGVQELEETFGLDLNGMSLERAWKVMAVFVVAGYVSARLTRILGDICALLSGVCGMASVACAVWYIVVFYRAWKAWEGREIYEP